MGGLVLADLGFWRSSGSPLLFGWAGGRTFVTMGWEWRLGCFIMACLAWAWIIEGEVVRFMACLAWAWIIAGFGRSFHGMFGLGLDYLGFWLFVPWHVWLVLGSWYGLGLDHGMGWDWIVAWLGAGSSRVLGGWIIAWLGVGYRKTDTWFALMDWLTT